MLKLPQIGHWNRRRASQFRGQGTTWLPSIQIKHQRAAVALKLSYLRDEIGKRGPQMAEIAGTAGIEPRGDKFVIYLTDNGIRHELEITEEDILIFSRLIPSFLRRIVARWNLEDGIVAAAAIPVTAASVNDDLHGTEVILAIQDVAGGDFEFWLSADQARKLGAALLERADKIAHQSARSSH